MESLSRECRCREPIHEILQGKVKCDLNEGEGPKWYWKTIRRSVFTVFLPLRQ